MSASSGQLEAATGRAVTRKVKPRSSREIEPSTGADDMLICTKQQDQKKVLTYTSYLRLNELLDVQLPQSDPPHSDELHFIITHQAIELWLKLLLSQVRDTRDALDRREWNRTNLLVKRMIAVTEAILGQMRTLQRMAPAAFCKFRSALGSASGAQSRQSRHLEVLCGIRGERHIATMRAFDRGQLGVDIGSILGETSLREAFLGAVQAAGYIRVADVYLRDSEDNPVYLVAELLVDFDEAWSRWRNEHQLLAERMIGQSRGTGGTVSKFLEHNRHYRFFPELWDCRQQIVHRTG
ncbi:MAG: tryptophan 2,3-dioxygenase family protein [Pseudonocardiaceae bacterium]